MASHKNFDLEHDKDGIAWITMDVAGRSVNVLTHSVMDELISIVDRLAEDPPAGLVLCSGKERGFIFGADINEFDRLDTRKKIHAHIATVLACFQKIEDMPCPSVVLVDGICLGGGFELALAFDRIIGIDHPSCQIGFPEINLGLLPGYGGSARSFTRLGVAGALDLVLHGKPMQARKAVDAGAMDELVATRDALKPAAVARIKADIKTGKRRPSHTDREGASAASSSTTPGVAEAIQSARKAIEARHIRENTPAPFAIIDHYAMDAPSQAGLIANESELFCDLMPTPASVGLRRTFQLNDLVKKGGRGDPAIKRVHVIGAGTMGGDIAAVAAMSGFEVTLQDISGDAIKAALKRARALCERRLKSPELVEKTLARLTADATGAGLGDADVLIEAVAEDLEIKKKVFADAETRTRGDAILATNTSAIPLEQIGEALRAPERLIGIHFFNPMPVLPLVEVVRTSKSRPEFVQRAMYLCGAMKKQPVACKSAPGFLVNRALLPYLFKAIDAVIDGAEPDKLDQALVRFGMPMGPIELCDQVGLDVCHDAGSVIGMSSTSKARLREMIDAGSLGRKSGSGFYEWDDKKAKRARAAYDAGELDAIASDLLAPLVKECRDAVREGVVESSDMADAACIMGIGFPAFRGGPIFWAKYKAA